MALDASGLATVIYMGNAMEAVRQVRVAVGVVSWTTPTPVLVASSAGSSYMTIGRGAAFASFLEALSLSVGSRTQARAVWKNTAKGGTRTMAASYR